MSICIIIHARNISECSHPRLSLNCKTKFDFHFNNAHQLCVARNCSKLNFNYAIIQINYLQHNVSGCRALEGCKADIFHGSMSLNTTRDLPKLKLFIGWILPVKPIFEVSSNRMCCEITIDVIKQKLVVNSNLLSKLKFVNYW